MFTTIRGWFTRTPFTRRRGPSKRVLLRIEFLEERCAPAAYVVDTLADNVADDGLLSLREAITLTNLSGDESVSITFAQNLPGALVNLTDALPDIAPMIASSVNIDGTMSFTRITIARDLNRPAFRVLTLGNGANELTVNLSNMIIQDGRQANGGGLFVTQETTANLYQVEVRHNIATFDGGGIYNEGTATLENSDIHDNDGGRGGGIHNHNGVGIDPARLWIQSETLIISNRADDAGGGIFNNLGNTVVISDSRIESNSAGFGVLATGRGGGIYNRGTVQMSNSTLSGNWALNQGGGLYTERGTSTLTSVLITNNTAQNLANGGGGGFYIQANATLSFTNCTLTGNHADLNESDGGWVEAGANFAWTGPPWEDHILFEF